MSSFKYLKISFEESVMVLVIDHAPANALSQHVMQELEQAIQNFETSNEARALIITGAGSLAFVAGADIRELIQINSAARAEELARKGQKVLTQIENSSKPVIAAVNGVCLGGGNELAMSCHIRIASDRARFGQPEINLGIIPGFGGTQRLARICGIPKAIELNLTGDIIPASEALRIGLVNRVVKDEELMKETIGFAKRIAAKGTKAIAYILEAIRKGAQMSLEEGLAYEAKLFGKVCETRDMKEGLTAFIEKRQPQFTGQ